MRAEKLPQGNYLQFCMVLSIDGYGMLIASNTVPGNQTSDRSIPVRGSAGSEQI
jgi:hypothetical protein